MIRAAAQIYGGEGERGGGAGSYDHASKHHHQKQQPQLQQPQLQQLQYSDDDEPSSHAAGQGQGLVLGPVKVKGRQKLAPGQGPVKGAGGAKGAVRRNKQGQGLAPGSDPSINHHHHHNNNHNNNHNDDNTNPGSGLGLGPGLSIVLGRMHPLMVPPDEPLVQSQAQSPTPSQGSSSSTAGRRPGPHYR